ncbi:response regulator [Aurantiacibacter sp. D1-12]|uniref:response regulator n=1 Tax=Aurantiacibacter sp. D1-12 TaxID=2993658 RepID=UPI00237CF728|nr:response regulator [Aurantiacibacter sp. D1-12]MDE1467146.1 response regulator [Aurantiacibacter sp. D1-12]
MKPPARVLLVEDDAILALALEDALTRAGTRDVVVCQTMKATMRELHDGPRPDAIVLDVHLADRDDGWAIAELVTALGPRPPRIAFSTGSPEDIPTDIAEMGVTFEKPYDPDELVKALCMRDKASPFALLKR